MYAVDGRAMTYSNAAEDSQTAPSLFGLVVHVLSAWWLHLGGICSGRGVYVFPDPAK